MCGNEPVSSGVQGEQQPRRVGVRPGEGTGAGRVQCFSTSSAASSPRRTAESAPGSSLGCQGEEKGLSLGRNRRRLFAAAGAAAAEQRPRAQQGYIRAAARPEADSWLTESRSLPSGLCRPQGGGWGGAPTVYTYTTLARGSLLHCNLI